MSATSTATPTLEEIQKLRQQMVDALNRKIGTLKQEKFEFERQYDEDIDQHEAQLRMLGTNIPQVNRTTERSSQGEQIYRYLLEHPGHHGASEIKRNVRGITGVVAILLQPFILAGKVERTGERRDSTYKAMVNGF
jgi:hypothetical protein